MWTYILHLFTWGAIAVAGLATLPMIIQLLIAMMMPTLKGKLYSARSRIEFGEEAERLGQPLPLSESVFIDIYRLVYMLGGSAIIGAIGLFTSPIGWAAVQLLFSAWCLGVDSVGLVHEAHGRRRKAQDDYNRRHRIFVLGVGLISLAFFAIPLIQLIAPLPITTGAAAVAQWVWRESRDEAFSR